MSWHLFRLLSFKVAIDMCPDTCPDKCPDMCSDKCSDTWNFRTEMFSLIFIVFPCIDLSIIFFSVFFGKDSLPSPTNRCLNRSTLSNMLINWAVKLCVFYHKSMLNSLLQSFIVDYIKWFIQKCGYQFFLLRPWRCHVFWAEGYMFMIVMNGLGIVYFHLQ